MFEVYINGSAKFEGTLARCEAFAKMILRANPDAEIQIVEIED